MLCLLTVFLRPTKQVAESATCFELSHSAVFFNLAATLVLRGILLLVRISGNTQERGQSCSAKTASGGHCVCDRCRGSVQTSRDAALIRVYEGTPALNSREHLPRNSATGALPSPCTPRYQRKLFARVSNACVLTVPAPPPQTASASPAHSIAICALSNLVVCGFIGNLRIQSAIPGSARAGLPGYGCTAGKAL